jgi:hypothetical protein
LQLQQKKGMNPDEFWAEYQEKIGEKVLAFTLGRYVSGWSEFKSPLWGLLIVCENTFRFHHFPHENWIDSITRNMRGGDFPKEQTLELPREQIVSVEVVKDASIWKRIIFPSPPRVRLRFNDAASREQSLVFEVDFKIDEVKAALQTTPATAETQE